MSKKREELKTLDDLLLKRYIAELESGNPELKDLAQISAYLAKNNETSEKEEEKKESEHEKIQGIVDEA